MLGLHALGFFLLIALVAPHHYELGRSGAFVIGTGLTAYTLGLRHAFDADHISAIDNTTRKLMGEGKRPMSVGFWFSLGHSTVVFVLAFLLAAGVRSLSGSVRQPRLPPARADRGDRHQRVRRLPVPDRRTQPGGAVGDRPGAARDAPRPL